MHCFTQFDCYSNLQMLWSCDPYAHGKQQSPAWSCWSLNSNHWWKMDTNRNHISDRLIGLNLPMARVAKSCSSSRLRGGCCVKKKNRWFTPRSLRLVFSSFGMWPSRPTVSNEKCFFGNRMHGTRRNSYQWWLFLWLMGDSWAHLKWENVSATCCNTCQQW